MEAYIPLVVWIVSNIAALYILHWRGVSPNLFWRIFGVVLGPFAIPFAFFIGRARPISEEGPPGAA